MFDIKSMQIKELEECALKIRNRIIDVVSRKGGHLSSNLGSVEIILAMHYVFDCYKDPFIFDVSHQAYAHKLLTNRWDEFESIRQINGISGYINPEESPSDYFKAGHSSTSLSIGVGAARAIKLSKENRIPVVLIGDGSMSSGLVYEALDEIGDVKHPMVIILNDNEMSISKPIGAISKYLSTATTGRVYQGFKDRLKKLLNLMPESATYVAKRFEESFKLITPGILFEELGLDYVGPIDGHNLVEIINILKRAKELKKPILIHAQTIKGCGYKIAEGKYEKWHSVPPFCIEDGKPLAKKSPINPTSVFSKALFELAKVDEKIVGVTAAMPTGTGLDLLMDNFPDRFIDVAIAEAHATTSMAAMAKEGYKPFVTIYSTFLQRAFDSIIHDVSIMNLPVRFAIDRAGIVGEDGETHQGIFDVAYLSMIPNMVVFAPRDYESLKLAVLFASLHSTSPIAFRYPRGAFLLEDNYYENAPFELGKAEILHEGKGDIAFFAFGNGVGRAHLVNTLIESRATLVDLRFAKPLDSNLIIKIAKEKKKIYIFSDNVKIGGIGSMIASLLLENSIFTPIKSFEFEDAFISHGNTKEVDKQIGVDASTISKAILEDLEKIKK